MVEIALRRPLARSAAQTRSKRYAQASDEGQRPPEGNPFGAGGFWRMASLLVGYDAQGIAPSSRLALRQNPLRLRTGPMTGEIVAGRISGRSVVYGEPAIPVNAGGSATNSLFGFDGAKRSPSSALDRF